MNAIVVILALFAAPLTLYARGASGIGDRDNMCCINRGSHVPHSHHENYESNSKDGMACHHDDASQALHFSMK